MNFYRRLIHCLSGRIASYLTKALPQYDRYDEVEIDLLAKHLQIGDVLLVDGNSRVGKAIKYLTQSTWSHACICVASHPSSAHCKLVEADIHAGVIKIALDKYQGHNLRICRPIGLTDKDKIYLLDYIESRIGHQYDLDNVLDLVRYLVQTPPVPQQYRRQLIALGSGEPTKAICSTLIAQAFQQIEYPILPRKSQQEACEKDQVCLQRRHFSHFVPRDFDVSPYFAVIKPTIEQGFDFKRFHWIG